MRIFKNKVDKPKGPYDNDVESWNAMITRILIESMEEAKAQVKHKQMWGDPFRRIPVPNQLEGRNFYVTFGQQYRREPHPSGLRSIHPDGWYRIIAPTQNEALAIVQKYIGKHYHTLSVMEPDLGLYHMGELGLIDYKNLP